MADLIAVVRWYVILYIRSELGSHVIIGHISSYLQGGNYLEQF